jgi:glycosyltransferase involved in cell wall biosynthesis
VPNTARTDGVADAARKLRVLSLGSTRGLWATEENDEIRRMRGYARGISRYTVLVSSRRRHRMRELNLEPNFRAIPSGGLTAFNTGLRLLWRAHRELSREDYDLIQAQEPPFLGTIAALAALVHRVPLNVCVYGPNPFDPYWRKASFGNRFLALLGEWVLRRSAGVQVDGAMTERSLVDHGIPADHVYRKPMVPGDVQDFFDIPRPSGPSQADSTRPIQLLFIGRLCDQKNLPLLLRSVAALRGRASRAFELKLVGEGPLEKRLRALSLELGISDLLEFTGHLSRRETLDHFRSADLFVLPSFYEGFPRVLVEAAAAGLPIVSTAVSGTDEMIVDGSTGFIVPIDAQANLVDKLCQLIDDQATRQTFGRNARQHAEAQLSNAASPAMQLAIWTSIVERQKAKQRRG